MADHTDREEALFEAALELETPVAQAEFLRRYCAEDETLRERVKSLLEAHRRAAGFLEKPPEAARRITATALKASHPPTGEERSVAEKPGDRIGPYRLLQKIGEGGCGVVYMAEQETPVRRRVALKIIKAGMDTRQVIARFEAERQALAMMEHPNIARVLDAGATETGRPFFVMDLVRGIRITEYCDQHKLSTEERLVLFAQVCHAIQHAHQKGIIHRDIKPSNILVTLHDGMPVPVIIDFGIAKATEQRLTDKTLFTAFQQFIGTPAYMSPEQAEMSRLDIDTRSDIYSLGVLLYELLTGRTPFDPKTLLQAGIDEMRRTIREKEPPRPSTRLSTMVETDLTTVARHRHAEPLRLITLLRGDLDWIVMKCLEKDRTRRYETANGLALDIHRHLHNEPVLARPPSKVYRLQKLMRRNKVAFAAGTVVAVALVTGLALSTHLLLRERKAYSRAVLAEQNETRLRVAAQKAQASETQQRHLAEESARRSRLNSYAADVHSAFLALRDGNLGRAVDLLEHQLPRPGEEDVRGFEWRYLWQQTIGDDLVSLPHEGLVSCALFSPDGQHLATASYDGQLRIWDLSRKRVLRTVSGFERQFGWRYIAYSPNGHWLAGIREGRITVWDCTREDWPVVSETPAAVSVLAFTPDSSRLVAWGGAGLVIQSTGTWQAITLPTQLRRASFPALAIEPSGHRVALAHDGKHAIEIWSLTSGIQEHFFSYPSSQQLAFVSLAWAEPSLMAANTWSGDLLLIDPRTGQELARTQAHAGTAFGLAFAPGHKTLVTAGHDQRIHFWTVPELEKVGTLHGHRDEIWSLAFSPDGQLLCTAGKDGTARLWKPEPRPPPVFIPEPLTAEFTADSRQYVTLCGPLRELALTYWDVANPGMKTTKSVPVADRSHIADATLSPGARFMALRREDGASEVWNIETGKLVLTRSSQEPPVSAVSFSTTGSLLATATIKPDVEVWNLSSGEVTRMTAPGLGRIQDLRFSPGDAFLLTESDKSALVWDLQSGTALSERFPATERFEFSPDGRILAVTDTNYAVHLLDLPGLKPRTTVQGHRWTVYSLAFSPTSAVLATGGGDAVARIWDTRTGGELCRPLRGHLQGVSEVAFAPDGRILATGSTDNSVKIWHVATGRELFGAPESSRPTFSPDGNTLLLYAREGRRLLHVPSLAAIDAARTIANP